MAFAVLEDRFDSFDVVIFPKQYEQYHSVLKEDTPLLVKGTVSIRDGKASVLADTITEMLLQPDGMWIRFDTMQDYQCYGKQSYPGTESSIAIYVQNPRCKKIEKSCLTLDNECIQEAIRIFGAQNIALIPV